MIDIFYKHQLLTEDPHGDEHQFLYALEESDNEEPIVWTFRVKPYDLNAIDWYEFAVTKLDDSIGKVTLMQNWNMPEYRRKGITEKIIAEASEVLEVTIISSTNNPIAKRFESEKRTASATTIWERLRSKGKASYDKETDIYTFIKK